MYGILLNIYASYSIHNRFNTYTFAQVSTALMWNKKNVHRDFFNLCNFKKHTPKQIQYVKSKKYTQKDNHISVI